MIRASAPWDNGNGTIEWEEDDWVKKGNCGTEDPEIFFPDPRSKLGNEKAKSICSGCPVKLDCFQYAIDRDLRFGVWGGFGELDRERLTGRLRKS